MSAGKVPLCVEAQPKLVTTWVTEKWDADEKPYIRIKNEIRSAVAKGKKPDVLAVSYEGAYKRKSDRFAAFRWGTAAYLAYAKADAKGNQSSIISMYGSVCRAVDAMASIPSPRSYEFARLRFLMQALMRSRAKSSDQLKVGERLVQRNPKDIEVGSLMQKYWGYSMSVVDRHKAVSLALKMAKANPTYIYRLAYVARAYLNLWSLTGKREDRLAAIEAYRQYLKVLPANNPYRVTAKELMEFLEKSKDKTQSTPKLKSKP